MAHQRILTSTLTSENLEMTDSAKLCSHSEGFCILAIKKLLSYSGYRPVQLKSSQTFLCHKKYLFMQQKKTLFSLKKGIFFP